MRTLTLMLTTSLALTACGDKDSIDSVPEADADTEADSDTDTDTDADTDLPATASMSGVVVDGTGKPLEGIRLNVCKEVCRTVSSDGEGAFEFEEFEAEWVHAFDGVDPSGERMSALTLLKESADVHRGDVQVTMLEPAQTEPMPSTPTETALCGVHLTVSKDLLTLPFGEDGETLTCTQAPPPTWLLWDELPGTPLQVWYLGPFDAHTDEGLDFWIDNQLGLDEGATVHAWAADYANTAWSDAGTLTVVDGRLVSDGTLHLLSTLILVEE